MLVYDVLTTVPFGADRFPKEIAMVSKIFATLLAALSLVGTLASCAVVESAGRGLERGGQEIQQEAREHGARQ